MANQVRAFDALTIPEIQQLGREQAEAFHALEHPYSPGSTEAVAWERAYRARQIELQSPDTV
jgi:hypothetical protein